MKSPAHFSRPCAGISIECRLSQSKHPLSSRLSTSLCALLSSISLWMLQMSILRILSDKRRRRTSSALQLMAGLEVVAESTHYLKGSQCWPSLCNICLSKIEISVQHHMQFLIQARPISSRATKAAFRLPRASDSAVHLNQPDFLGQS